MSEPSSRVDTTAHSFPCSPEFVPRLHDDLRKIYLHLKAPRFDLHRRLTHSHARPNSPSSPGPRGEHRDTRARSLTRVHSSESALSSASGSTFSTELKGPNSSPGPRRKHRARARVSDTVTRARARSPWASQERAVPLLTRSSASGASPGGAVSWRRASPGEEPLLEKILSWRRASSGGESLLKELSPEGEPLLGVSPGETRAGAPAAWTPGPGPVDGSRGRFTHNG
jgi:hypothetical protein